MSAKPERDNRPFIGPGGDDADQLRSLLSAMLSGASRDDSYLSDVAFLCQSKPESGRRLLDLIERYNRLGQIPAAQYHQIRRRIEDSLSAPGQARQRSPDPRERKRQAKHRQRERSGASAAQRSSERASTVTATVPVRATSLPLPAEATTTAPLPTASPAGSKTAPDHRQAQPSRPMPAATRSTAAPAASVLPSSWPATPEPQAPRPRQTPPDQRAPPARQAPAAPQAAPLASAAQSSSRTDLIIEPGAVLRERYELEKLIGCGGMASVYKARDRYRASLGLSDCHVALKIVTPDSATRADDTGLGREFHNAQQLSHPNIVNVFEIDREAGATFYTMELLEGEQLDTLQVRLGGPLPRTQALAIVRDIGAAIEHAHSRGILHADLKPQNVFITYGGQVRILDFGGLSIPAPGPWISEPPYDAASGAAERYRTATPAYASCEQLEGQKVDARDDIFALACIGYELLTGRHPFDGSSALQARAQHLHPRRPSQLRAGNWRALRRALSFQRARRPRDIAAWLEQLGVAEADPRLPPSYELRALPPASHWGRGVALAAAVLLCVGAAATLVLRTPESLEGQQWFSSGLNSLQLARTRVQDRVALWRAAAAAPSVGQLSQPRGNTRPALPAPSALAPANPTSPGSLPGSAKHHAAGGVAVMGAGAAVSSAADSATPPAPQLASSEPPQPLEFSSASYEVHDSAPAARVVVRRSGDTQNELRFVWWTQDDTAKADVDYAPLGRRTEHLLPGQDHMTLYVPIISNPLRHTTTTFFVALGQPGEMAAPPSARASVTIERGG